MKILHLVFMDAAVADILEQAEWYRGKSGEDLAVRWERRVTAALLRIVRYPSTGARCNFRSAELQSVRRTRIQGFSKHLVFDRVEGEDLIVLRVLHGARDLESLF